MSFLSSASCFKPAHLNKTTYLENYIILHHPHSLYTTQFQLLFNIFHKTFKLAFNINKRDYIIYIFTFLYFIRLLSKGTGDNCIQTLAIITCLWHRNLLTHFVQISCIYTPVPMTTNGQYFLGHKQILPIISYKTE